MPVLFTEAARFRPRLDMEAALAELTIIPAEMPDSSIHGMRIGLCFRRSLISASGQLRAIPAPEVPARSDPAANPAAIGCRAPISDLHRTSAPPCGEQRREQRAATVEALQRAVANPWTRICAALRSFNELRCFSHRR